MYKFLGHKKDLHNVRLVHTKCYEFSMQCMTGKRTPKNETTEMRTWVELRCNCAIQAIIPEIYVRSLVVKASLRETLHSNKIFKVCQPISNRKVTLWKKGNSYYRCGAALIQTWWTCAIFRAINLFSFTIVFYLIFFSQEYYFNGKCTDIKMYVCIVRNLALFR